MKENRRSSRIVSRVPLEIRVIEAQREATTAVVNQHGALILSPVPYLAGETIDVTNTETQSSTRGRVVWSDPDTQGGCKMGVDFERRVTGFGGRLPTPWSELTHRRVACPTTRTAAAGANELISRPHDTA